MNESEFQKIIEQANKPKYQKYIREMNDSLIVGLNQNDYSYKEISKVDSLISWNKKNYSEESIYIKKLNQNDFNEEEKQLLKRDLDWCQHFISIDRNCPYHLAENMMLLINLRAEPQAAEDPWLR